MIEKTLLNEFNLAEKNPDQGGGILYCLRYDEDRIKGHQESVANALTSMGIEVYEVDEGIAVKPPKRLNKSEYSKFYSLLEEISCLNDALEYSAIGFSQFDNISELKNGLVTSYFDLLEEDNLADAYNMVTLLIPEIVGDLRIADHQNGVLSVSERKELTDLMNFAQRHYKLLNNSHGFVTIGL